MEKTYEELMKDPAYKQIAESIQKEKDTAEKNGIAFDIKAHWASMLDSLNK